MNFEDLAAADLHDRAVEALRRCGPGYHSLRKIHARIPGVEGGALSVALLFKAGKESLDVASKSVRVKRLSRPRTVYALTPAKAAQNASP